MVLMELTYVKSGSIALISERVTWFRKSSKHVAIYFMIANRHWFFGSKPVVNDVWIEKRLDKTECDGIISDVPENIMIARTKIKREYEKRMAKEGFLQKIVDFLLELFSFAPERIIESLQMVSDFLRTSWKISIPAYRGNVIATGQRDKNTGEVELPLVFAPACEGLYSLYASVGKELLRFDFKLSQLEEPDPKSLQALYYAGDGHIHTDYSWFSPRSHEPNGFPIETISALLMNTPLRWAFLTDYAVQFFSRYAKGGITHLSNDKGYYTYVKGGEQCERRKVVWNDRLIEVIRDNVMLGSDLLVVAGEEVPSLTDSHTLVWGIRDNGSKKWSWPKRIRRECNDLPMFTKYLFGDYYEYAYSHDNPWQDKEERINPYECYKKEPYNKPDGHPYEYLEVDLVNARGFKDFKPFLIAAHPLNPSYLYLGFELGKNNDGLWPNLSSHANGQSALIGFEIFDDPLKPQRVAKNDMLVVWNMILWRELEKSFETRRFFVAVSNSDAHMFSFSGAGKFSQNMTHLFVEDGLPDVVPFIHFKDEGVGEEKLRESIEKILSALECGHCCCTSTGDFGTFVVKKGKKLHHPGSFVDVKPGESIDFIFEVRPQHKWRKLKEIRLFTLHKPLPSKPTDDETAYMKQEWENLKCSYKRIPAAIDSTRIELTINPNDTFYPGIDAKRCKDKDDAILTLYRAEFVFVDNHNPDNQFLETVTYTNPIFVKLSK